jgi:hypothetical protein
MIDTSFDSTYTRAQDIQHTRMRSPHLRAIGPVIRFDTSAQPEKRQDCQDNHDGADDVDDVVHARPRLQALHRGVVSFTTFFLNSRTTSSGERLR